MSRNNLIGVIKYKRVFYVLSDLNADMEWNYEACLSLLKRSDVIAKPRRGQALCAAHNMQQKLQTEYGVREMRRDQ